jgi:hypothetical protein
MWKPFLLANICYLLFAGSTHAQAWCAPEAQWYHNYYAVWGDEGYIEAHYAGDVLFADSLCQELVLTQDFYSHQNNTVTYGSPFSLYTTTSTNGLVHVWTGSEFDTLFRFNAVPGDHWDLPGDNQNIDARITVSDTGHGTIGGISLRYLAVEASNEGFTLIEDTLFERIGPMQMYLELSRSEFFWIDGGWGSLRCYSDEEIEFSRIGGPCEMALTTETFSAHTELRVYPNPANDMVTVQWDGSERSSFAALIDMTGREVQHWPALHHTDSELLQLDGIADGQYVLHLKFEEGYSRVLMRVSR